jgi:hypothetical protein
MKITFDFLRSLQSLLDRFSEAQRGLVEPTGPMSCMRSEHGSPPCSGCVVEPIFEVLEISEAGVETPVG